MKIRGKTVSTKPVEIEEIEKIQEGSANSTPFRITRNENQTLYVIESNLGFDISDQLADLLSKLTR